MSLRRVRLPSELPGQLWLGAMPGRFSSWGSFQQQAQASELNVVVCLTPRPEMQELSPEYHAAVGGGRLPFRWVHLPMRNFGVPDDPAGFRREVEALAQ